jgi:steroid delta-isomerase
MDGESMRRAVLRYLELVAAGDVDGVVALMADDVSVEDPVGGPPATHVVGREKVRAFFRAGFSRANPRPGPIGPVCTTAGGEAAVSFQLVLTRRGGDVELDVIDVVRFDDRGRIRSLRAFWNAAEMRDVGVHPSTAVVPERVSQGRE